MDKEIFIKNLSEITGNMKQKEIAAISGCAESTMSKYLNKDTKDFPPVDILCNLSVHFHVSIDWLIGNNITNEKLSLRDICRFFTEIYQQTNLGFCKTSVYEIRYILGDYGFGYQDGYYEYEAIYFPEYSEIAEEDILEEFEQRKQDSNENVDYNSKHINNFLSRFSKINTMKKEGNLDEEMYNRLIDSYLDNVPNDY